MKNYNLEAESLEVKQGFAYLTESRLSGESEAVGQLRQALILQVEKGKEFQLKIDSIQNKEALSTQIFTEIKAQYPLVKTAIIQPVQIMGDGAMIKNTVLVYLSYQRPFVCQKKEKWTTG